MSLSPIMIVGQHELDSIPLEEVKELSCAVILTVDGDSEDVLRLKAMGLCAGRKIELVQHGDPMILRVFGTRIGLSRRFTTGISVMPCERITCPHFLA